MPASVIAEESTTLPEGAIISVALCEKARPGYHGISYTLLVARRAEDKIEMRLMQRVSPHALGLLLKLAIREIQRLQLSAKPYWNRTPKSMQGFVAAMMFKDMFLTPILTKIEEPVNNENNTDKKAKKPASKHTGVGDSNTGVPKRPKRNGRKARKKPHCPKTDNLSGQGPPDLGS